MHKKSASREVSSITVPAAWAVHELAGAGLPDQRLLKRAHLIMTQLGERPAASLPQACGGWSQTKAAYRFLDNDAVNPQALLAAHTQATVGRMQDHAVVLALQDTTTLNYSAHPQTEGLGPIGNNRDQTIGLWLHSTLAVSVGGEPLGMLSAAALARDPRRFGSSRQAQRRNRQPIAEKESQRWQIEVLHKTLKSGCQVERRQLETAERLRRVLMLDLIVAWRVMHLCKGAREKPADSVRTWLEESEWTVLFCYFNRGRKASVRPPTLRQAVRWIGRLGGFLARRSDGEPGPTVLWRGLQRLQDLAQAWMLLNNCG